MYDNKFRVPNKAIWGNGPGNENTSPIEQQYFQYYFQKFINLALSRYEYDGLPKEIPPRVLNSYLLWDGLCIFKKAPVIEDTYGIFGVNLVGEPDVYGIPMDRIAYGMNGSYYDYADKDDSVLIFARPFIIPEIQSIILHAQSLAEKKASCRVNVIQQRTPVIVSADSTQKLTVDNFLHKWVQNIPFIRVKKDFKTQVSTETIDLGVKALFNELDTACLREVAECLADLGIEASGVEKPERLVSAETSYNDGEIEMARNGNLSCIQRGLDAANEMFGLDMHVRFNSNMVTNINMPEEFKKQTNTEPQETESREEE